MGTTGEGPGTIGTQTLTQEIPPGIVTQAMFTVDAIALGPAALHVSMIITPIGATIATPLYVLTSGYVTIMEPLMWSGLLSLDSSSQIIATLTGQLNGNFNLDYRRLTLTSIADIGRYIKGLLNA